MLDAWVKKIPPEFLQCSTFTLDKPKYLCIGHRFKRSLSLLPLLRKLTSFSFGKNMYPTWFCIYSSICACDRRQAPKGEIGHQQKKWLLQLVCRCSEANVGRRRNYRLMPECWGPPADLPPAGECGETLEKHMYQTGSEGTDKDECKGRRYVV